MLDFVLQFAASSHDKYCWGADKVKTSDTSARPLSHTKMLSFQHKTNAFLAKRNKIWLSPKKGSISGGERGGLGDIWADLRPGPDPGFLDGIRALVGSGAHRAAGQNFIAAKWRVRKY